MIETETGILDFSGFSEATPPWPLGCDPALLSEKAQSVWRVLALQEKFLVSRSSPFKKVRYQVLIRLAGLGVPYKIIGEMSGYKVNILDTLFYKYRKASHA